MSVVIVRLLPKLPEFSNDFIEIATAWREVRLIILVHSVHCAVSTKGSLYRIRFIHNLFTNKFASLLSV